MIWCEHSFEMTIKVDLTEFFDIITLTKLVNWDQAMQFGKVVADMILFRFGERNIQFSWVVFETNQLIKIRGDVSLTDFEDKYFEKY